MVAKGDPDIDEIADEPVISDAGSIVSSSSGGGYWISPGSMSYPIFARQQGAWDLGQINVPLGRTVDRRDVGKSTRPSVPTLVKSSRRQPTLKVLEPRIGTLNTSIQEALLVAAEQDRLRREAEARERQRVRMSPSPTGGGLIPPQSPINQPPARKKPMALDLGNVLSTGIDLYSKYQIARATPQYVEYKYGPSQVQPTMEPIRDTTGIDLMETIGIKKKCRRRRRRLATMSDIKDLAALKAVLGNGEAFKTWIATHPS